MNRFFAAVLLLLLPSFAMAEGGGGALVEAAYLPRYGNVASPHDAPGFVGCVGGSDACSPRLYTPAALVD